MANLAMCTGCQKMVAEEEIMSVVSVLDFQKHNLCWTCFDNHSEPIFVVLRTIGRQRWGQVSPVVQDSIMVFDSGEYVHFDEWARRTAKKQVIPVRRRRPTRPRPAPVSKQIAPPKRKPDNLKLVPEEEEMLERMMELMRCTAPGEINVAGPYDDLPMEGWFTRAWSWLTRYF